MNVAVPSGRINLAREAAFRLGGLTVQPSKRQVVAGQQYEFLQPRVMQVLVALARRRGEVVSRDELIMSCWNGQVVSDDAINRCIARLRRLAEAFGGFSLETIARVGYQLTEAPVAKPAIASSLYSPGRAATLAAAVLAAAALLAAVGFAVVH